MPISIITFLLLVTLEPTLAIRPSPKNFFEAAKRQMLSIVDGFSEGVGSWLIPIVGTQQPSPIAPLQPIQEILSLPSSGNELSPTHSSTSIFHSLSSDIVNLIFNYIHSAKDRASLARTCKRFHKLILSHNKQQLTYLDLSESTGFIKIKIFKDIHERGLFDKKISFFYQILSQYHRSYFDNTLTNESSIESLDLSYQHIPEEALFYIAAHFPKLKHINLNFCLFSNPDIIQRFVCAFDPDSSDSGPRHIEIAGLTFFRRDLTTIAARINLHRAGNNEKLKKEMENPHEVDFSLPENHRLLPRIDITVSLGDSWRDDELFPFIKIFKWEQIQKIYNDKNKSKRVEK